MPLILKQKEIKSKNLKVSVPMELFGKIEEYCAWAQITETDHFFKEAAKYVLAKDREWKAHKSTFEKEEEVAKLGDF